MPITFTERVATVFKRYLHLMEKAIVKLRRDEKLTYHFGNFKVTVEYDYDSLYLIFEYDAFVVDSTDNAYILRVFDYKVGSVDKMVDSLIGEYPDDLTLCSCKKKEAKQGWCEECYPLVCTQEKNCCLCNENIGVWVKLTKCKHILHKVCWMNTIDLKCPSCQVVQEHKEMYYIL